MTTSPRHHIGAALDRLIDVFPHMTVTQDLRVVLRDAQGSDVIATVGYSTDKVKKAGITITGLTDLRQMKAITGYATALEDLATPDMRQFR